MDNKIKNKIESISFWKSDISIQIIDGGITNQNFLVTEDLKKYVGEEVVNPIRAHVDSKRYLSAVEDGYYDTLSKASQISLVVQGGSFTKEEAEDFISKPFMKEAVEMRRFDDMAKILNKKTPNLNHFKPYLDKAFKSFALRNNQELNIK